MQQQKRTIVHRANVTCKATLLHKRQQFRQTERYKGTKTAESPPDAIIDIFSLIQEKKQEEKGNLGQKLTFFYHLSKKNLVLDVKIKAVLIPFMVQFDCNRFVCF